MKKTKKFKNRISLIGTAALIILSAIGSYQYYTQYVDTIVYDRLWSTVLYSTVKLYAFSPTVSAGAETPLCYEIAKWAAPLCTAYWIFRALETLLRHRLELFSRHFRKHKQILVFGYNDESAAYIRNLAAENVQNHLEKKDEYQIMLVTEQTLDQELRLQLERNHILIWQINLLDDVNTSAERNFINRWLKKCSEIALFYQDSTLNFVILRKLMLSGPAVSSQKTAAVEPQNRICSLRCEDSVMKKIITDFYDEFEGPKPFELSIFNMPEIAADDLFRKVPLHGNCLSWTSHKTAGKNLSANQVMEQIPNPHLLIAGFGRYGQAVLKEALLMGTLSNNSQVKGFEKLSVTIIDNRLRACKDMIESNYPRIQKICNLEYIDAEIGNPVIEQRLRQLTPVTYAAICFSEQAVNIRALEKLCRFFRITAHSGGANEYFPEKIPIAVRMKYNGTMLQYWAEHDNLKSSSVYEIHDFGTESKILTHQNITRCRMEEEARKFHASYAMIQALLLQKDGRQPSAGDTWEKLNFEKKESNRAQVRNLPYIQSLLPLLSPLPAPEEIIKADEPTELFLRKISSIPILNALASWEHSRWCNFCYSYGYVGYHPDKAEKGKEHRINDGGEYYGQVHYCLIDDWEQLKADKEAGKTAVYDICSIYVYAKGL